MRSSFGSRSARASLPGRPDLRCSTGSRLAGSRLERCVECGSLAASERPERTAQGYRRLRCRNCGKQFNQRSMDLLNRTQHPSAVFARVVP
jgi:DNA-directed RNA polymerase subunit RPC12/RpoP